MATKQMLLSALMLGATTNIALAMDETTATTKQLKEEFFQANISKLSTPIADFVMDFKTWSKENQNKIDLFETKTGKGLGYVIDSGLTRLAADKYNGSLGLYLDSQLNQGQITPFLYAMDYLKQQQ